MSTAARDALDDAEALLARAKCAAASLKNPSASSVPGSPYAGDWAQCAPRWSGCRGL
jgi:hypothetical protein